MSCMIEHIVADFSSSEQNFSFFRSKPKLIFRLFYFFRLGGNYLVLKSLFSASKHRREEHNLVMFKLQWSAFNQFMSDLSSYLSISRTTILQEILNIPDHSARTVYLLLSVECERAVVAGWPRPDWCAG